jgi:Holliday junction resolvase RusA-like endonuclease
MSSNNGKAAAFGSRGLPELDLLASTVDQGNNEISALTQAAPITITIRGPAVAKGRPRFSRKGFAYTPAKTREYEGHGRFAAQLAMGERPPLTGPVHLTALIELPIPASWSKRRTAAAIVGEIRPTSRPDIDNFLKSGSPCLS